MQFIYLYSYLSTPEKKNYVPRYWVPRCSCQAWPIHLCRNCFGPLTRHSTLTAISFWFCNSWPSRFPTLHRLSISIYISLIFPPLNNQAPNMERDKMPRQPQRAYASMNVFKLVWCQWVAQCGCTTSKNMATCTHMSTIIKLPLSLVAVSSQALHGHIYPSSCFFHTFLLL